MRASTQSVMYTLWSRSSVRTVSRSSVEWWPDSGATTSTAGSFFILSTVDWSSEKRLKRFSVQNGVAMRVHAMDVEFGFLVSLAQAVHELVAGRGALGARHAGERAGDVAKHLRSRLGPVGKRAEHGALPFVHEIEHAACVRGGKGGAS